MQALLNLSISVGLAILLAGCKGTEATEKPAVKQKQPMAPISSKPQVETLYDVNINSSYIEFTVVSNGCTKARNFVIDSKQTGENALAVTLLRLKPDYCRAMPRLITIKKDIKQLWLNSQLEITIKNPFSTQKPGRSAPRVEK